jgi:hypothetical protein
MSQAANDTGAGQCLRELYCRYYGCANEQFEERFLLDCLHAPRISKVLWRLDRDYFRDDLQMIHHLSRATSFAECRDEVEAHRHANPPAGWLRRQFRLRLSGHAVIRVASKLFKNHNLPKTKTKLETAKKG